MAESGRAVFLSYASQDAEAAARICASLRAAGIEVWFDQSELRGGDAWDHHIRRQIRDCALFVPIISANTQARAEGYFRLEWRLAEERSRLMGRARAFIVPVCIDRTTEKEADVPDSFEMLQWTRLPGGETPPSFTERINVLLGGTGATAGAPQGTAVLSPSLPPKRRTPLWVAAAIGGAVLLAGMAWQLWRTPSKQGAGTQASTPVAAVPQKSIAVLPFVDMSEKKDQEYFSDGLSEELIDHLSHNADLKVIARTSSFAFKGKNEDMRTIAAKLGVTNLLEGSVRKAGNQLRITAQLIRASDGVHLWSQIYDRTINDIFKVQDDIAVAIANALSVALSPEGRAAGIGTMNIEAYNVYLQGRYFLRQRKSASDVKALSLFQQAIRLDPRFADAWMMLSVAYGSIVDTAKPADRTATLVKEQSAAETALRLGPRNPDVRGWMAWFYMEHRDFAAAQREINEGMALDPSNLLLMNARANLSFRLGRWEDALSLSRRSVLRDPLSVGDYHTLAGSLHALGRHREAEQAYRTAMQLNPQQDHIHAYIAKQMLLDGRPEAALAEAQLEPDEDTRLYLFALVYPALGRQTQGDAALREMLKRHAKDDALGIAEIYAARGDVESAIVWLERSYNMSEPGLDVAKGAFDLYPRIKQEPRYKTLLRKLNLPED